MPQHWATRFKWTYLRDPPTRYAGSLPYGPTQPPVAVAITRILPAVLSSCKGGSSQVLAIEAVSRAKTLPIGDPVELRHNLDPRKFVFLWMKYVVGANDQQHCTNSLRGKYSRKLSKHNKDFRSGVPVVCDEQPAGAFVALYVCGVASAGYSKKLNYLHNLHLPILPAPGRVHDFAFEDWHVTIINGIALPVPAEEDLPSRYRALPPQFTTCRIFRWAVVHFQGAKAAQPQ